MFSSNERKMGYTKEKLVIASSRKKRNLIGPTFVKNHEELKLKLHLRAKA